MMNDFQYDRNIGQLDSLEKTIGNLPYADAKLVVTSLAEIRNHVEQVYKMSSHASHIWDEAIRAIGGGPVSTEANRHHTYVTQWAAVYELARRHLSRIFERGGRLQLIRSLNDFPRT